MDVRTLKKWNDWWVEKSVPKNKKRILRENKIEEIYKLFRIKEVIVLTGVRRSGKSTLIYQLIDKLITRGINPANILYFNFDDIEEDREISLLDSVYNSFLELNDPKGRKYLFFDEIQNINGWERWIKKNYDLYGEEIKFILTGSNNSMLHDNLSKLLTGRTITNNIFPLSFKEFLSFKEIVIKDMDMQKAEIKHHFIEYLNKGGFPEVALEKDTYINNLRLGGYFDSILLRDIIEPKNIRDVSKLIELARYCITNISSVLSYNSISKAIGLNIMTLKDYLNNIETAYLLFQINFFSYSLKETLAIQKPKKIYCIDNGLRNSAGFRFSKDEGKLAENIVCIELKRKNKEFYFWKNKNEVDFVVKNKDNSLTAINVSFDNKINEREIKGILEFKETFKKCRNCIIITRDLEKNENGILYVPLWKWLLD